jgi:acetyl esterase/lipase
MWHRPARWLSTVTSAVAAASAPYLVASEPARAQELLSAQDVVALEAPAPDLVIPYGEHELQFGHLRLPEGPGPHPVVVFIHGGCWLSAYTIGHVGSLEEGLSQAGFAVWSLEYRRVGDDGGGWPGTFQDVARGVDHLRVLAADHPLDLDRVVVSGHSAGGHLALWVASRGKLLSDHELYVSNPLTVQGVVGLAPAPDLEALHDARVCGNVIDGLMGGSPSVVPRRYAAASPMQLAPVPVPQTLVIGALDTAWGPVGRAYYRRALEAGDEGVTVLEAPQSGHFEMIVPGTSTWPLVMQAFERAFRHIEATSSHGLHGHPSPSTLSGEQT